jgi:hypothetical protein
MASFLICRQVRFGTGTSYQSASNRYRLVSGTVSNVNDKLSDLIGAGGSCG